jgi:hypothetical protein
MLKHFIVNHRYDIDVKKKQQANKSEYLIYVLVKIHRSYLIFLIYIFMV